MIPIRPGADFARNGSTFEVDRIDVPIQKVQLSEGRRAPVTLERSPLRVCSDDVPPELVLGRKALLAIVANERLLQGVHCEM